MIKKKNTDTRTKKSATNHGSPRNVQENEEKTMMKEEENSSYLKRGPRKSKQDKTDGRGYVLEPGERKLESDVQ